MKYYIHCLSVLILSMLCALPLCAQDAPQSADEIFRKAEKEKKNVVVLVRGSDYVRSGEIFKQRVWDNPEFRAKAEKNFICYEVDRKEYPNKDFELSLKNVQPPQNIKTTVNPESVSGATLEYFEGDIIASGTNPGQDVYEIALHPARDIENPCIRLTIKPDEKLANGAFGRSSNGSFCLTEILWEVANERKQTAFGSTSGKVELPVRCAWSDVEGTASHGIDKVYDGKQDGENYYNIDVSRYTKDIHIYIVLPRKMEKQASGKLKLVFKSRWDNHTIGRFSLDVYDDKAVCDMLQKKCLERTRPFGDFDTPVDAIPALLFYDHQGRLVAIENHISGVTGCKVKPTLAVLKDIQTAVATRDDCFIQAQKRTGMGRARILAKGLDAVQNLMPESLFRKHYKKIIESFKELDARDETGLSFKYAFNGRNFINEVNAALRDNQDGKVDKMLSNIKMSTKYLALNPKQRQEVAIAYFNYYRQSKDPRKQERAWKELETGRNLDKTTIYALGMSGIMAMNGRAPVVSIPYGWTQNHIKKSVVNWRITMGIKRHVDHVGDYRLTFHYKKGTAPMRIDTVKISYADVEIDAVGGPVEISKENPEGSFTFRINKAPKKTDRIAILVKGECKEEEECRGEISLTPFLVIE